MSLPLSPIEFAPDTAFDLLYEVLYQDFGVDYYKDDWRRLDLGGELLCHFDERGTINGVVRLMPKSAETGHDSLRRQVRQVAVASSARGKGVGRILMRGIEDRAALQGAKLLWLEARSSAYTFYENLGYVRQGDEFFSAITKIRHSYMEKMIVQHDKQAFPFPLPSSFVLKHQSAS